MDAPYFVAGVGMVMVAGGSVVYWYWRGRRVGRKYARRAAEPAGPRPFFPYPAPAFSPFAWGALGWILGGMLLKLPAAALLPVWVERHRPPGPAVWAALGLLTGVCEVGAVAGLAWVLGGRVGALRGEEDRRWRIEDSEIQEDAPARERPPVLSSIFNSLSSSRDGAAYWRAVAFGIGFGAAEACVVALDPLLSPLDPEAAASGPAVYTAGEALATVGVPVLERLNTMPVHALGCALAVYAVRAGRWGPFWLAFAYKAMVDALPAEKLEPWGPWVTTAAYLPFGVVGVVGLVMLGRRWVREESRTVAPPNEERTSAD